MNCRLENLASFSESVVIAILPGFLPGSYIARMSRFSTLRNVYAHQFEVQASFLRCYDNRDGAGLEAE